MVRSPVVAGQFYPANPGQLRVELDRFLEPDAPRAAALGILCPHAGYIYSGATAGKVFSRVELTPRMVLLGVNHRSIGAPFALYPRGQWRTPLGTVDVDEELADELLAASPHLEADPAAHAHEHSLEVELPFLQRLRDGVKIVPIIFGSRDPHKLRAVGESIGRVIRAKREPILLLSSSDMNHYEDRETAERKDGLAIAAIEALDPDRLLRVCEDEQVTMCGVAPTCVMLYAARQLGATRAELIDHSTSGDTSGDYSSVVGYAGMSVA
jgi:AmmeMemoRadiSam system protein B